MDMFKVIIAGGRDYDDYLRLETFMDTVLGAKEHNTIEIVSGTANGADSLGEKYAIANEFALTQFPAQWDKYGKSAGYKRNVEMVEYANALVAFWNGNTVRSGTNHMINIALERELPTRIVRY